MKKMVLLGLTTLLTVSVFVSAFATLGDVSEVMVYPTHQTVEEGEYVLVEILANLTTQVSGWEIEVLNFNSDILHLNSVEEGSLLSGVGATGFNPGDIDNINGVLTGCYCFTFTGVSATGNGSLCVLNFTAIDEGTAHITYVVELSLDGNTVDHTPSYGDIVVIPPQPPAIIDETPSTAYTGDEFTFSATVVDTDEVTSVWVEYWYGDSSDHVNETMIEGFDDTWSFTISSIPHTMDKLHYIIAAEDEKGHWNNTGVKEVDIEDNDPPSIGEVNIIPQKQYVGDNLNISVDAVDNLAVTEILINITDPTSATTSISILENKNGDTYYLNASYQIVGKYTFTIFVRDEAGNSNTSATYTFYIYPRYDLNKDGVVDINDITNITGHYGEAGSPRWIPQDINTPPDGLIDIKDITRVTAHYGEEYQELIGV